MKKPIKAARVLADLTQQQLCNQAGIPLITLRRLEGRASHKGLVSEETEAQVIAALEAAGIQFLEGGQVSSGPGVSLRVDTAKADAP